MTHRRINRRSRAFTLMELVLLLPMFLSLLVGAYWLLNVQMSTHDRLARQADRHAVMRAILTTLRTDLATAARLDVSTPPALAELPAEETLAEPLADGELRIYPPPGRGLLATLTLAVPEGEIRYQLYEDPPLVPQPVDIPIDPETLPRRLVRVTPDGQTGEWSLRGLMLDFEPLTGAKPEAVRIRFQSRNKSEGARQSLRRFETTLLAGGME